MGRIKDLYIETLERLIDEYCEKHPGTTYDEAYDKCSDNVNDAIFDAECDRADTEYKRKKEDGL